jgi:RNA polymerase sigma factor for flagellar operon FliA
MKNASQKIASAAAVARAALAKKSATAKVTADHAGDAAACRVEAGIPFVEALARRMAATMPHSIDISDLVQDGVIGLIDAAHRFDDSRGIKFETFAERRIRGAMIDALRKDAWPRGVRRVRRELEAAREKLRASLGHEPSLADLAQAIGSDEKRLGKTIVRINTIESTSPFSNADTVDETQLPAVLVPAEPERPDLQYERDEVKNRVRNAIATLPPREQRVIALYYYNEVTMKDIGAELGVNESRVSQLHARAIRRLKEALGAETTPVAASEALRAVFEAMENAPKAKMAKVESPKPKIPMPESDTRVPHAAQKRAGLVLVSNNDNTQASVSRADRSKSPNLKGLESQRQPVSSRKRSASVPATSPVTKITRRASAGVAAAIAR